MLPLVEMRVLALMAFAIAGCRTPADAPSDAAELGPRLRVGTFNVRRFFDTICDSGSCDDGGYEGIPTQSAFDMRADQIAKAIVELDADVIALQEFETQTCLDAVLARLATEMPHGVLGEIGGTATVDVAVLSRTPIEQVIRHRDTTPLMLADGTVNVFSRELLETHVPLEPTGKLVVFAAHFKAKSNDQPLRRLAEAEVSARLVNERASAEPAALVVLAGDLNDTPGSPPLQALTDAGLIRLADDLPTAQQGTYVFNGRIQAIDHVLLAPSNAAARVPRSSRAWGLSTGWGGSDHAALTTELYLSQ